MKRVKYSLVAVAFLTFVGCGGGGSDSADNSSKDIQNNTDTQVISDTNTEENKEVSFANLQKNIKEAKVKVDDVNSQAFKDIIALEDAIKKLQILYNENSTKSRAVIPINFDLTTIPARLQLANELLKAIVLTATSSEYKYKKLDAINKITLKIVEAIFNVVNPLSNNQNIKNSINGVNNQLNELKSSPNQDDNDISNVNLKEDLAKILREYREKSKNITNSVQKADFDGYILKVTGVRLNPKASVAEIKMYINEIPKKYLEALETTNNEVELQVENENLTQEQIHLVFGVLKGSQDLSNIENISSDVKNQIDKLVKIFGGLGLLNKVNITGTALSFDLKTLNERSKLAIDIIRTIVISTNDFKYKIEDVHVRLGFSVTNALIIATNPFANKNELLEAIQRLNDDLNWAKNQNNVKNGDIASLYIKEAMAKKLREYRTFQFNILKNKSKDVIDNFNQKILEATGVRLNPNATVQEVYNTLKNLENAAQEAIKSADLSNDQISASQAQRMELDTLLHKARFLDLVGKTRQAREKLNEIVGKITAIRLDLNSSIKDIEDAKIEIQQAMEDAKNSQNLDDNLVAPLSLKTKLSNLLAKARFTIGVGFLNKDVISADKVYWNTQATVKEVLSSIEKLEKLTK